jgi:hypothetical protein
VAFKAFLYAGRRMVLRVSQFVERRRLKASIATGSMTAA